MIRKGQAQDEQGVRDIAHGAQSRLNAAAPASARRSWRRRAGR
jgi:hypothetical protein